MLLLSYTHDSFSAPWSVFGSCTYKTKMCIRDRVIGVTSGAYTYGNNMYLAVPVDPVMAADLTVSGWTLKEVKAIEAAKDKD